MSSFDNIVLSVMTHPGAPLLDRAEAAAAAGFSGIGLRPGDLDRARRTGISDDHLRRRLDDLGISVVEIDVLVGWGLDEEARSKARGHEERIYELADTLGAHHLTVTGDLIDGIDAGAERFAAVCDRAAEHGLIVALEFLPWTEVADAATAGRIIDVAGRANGG
ncbi:MAG: sugar phosphate isomerase/epimerase family protein, partial [Nostocoides sp.]